MRLTLRLFAAVLLSGFGIPADGSATEFSFPTRILPILTHAGCNAGACHGAATGQGGFRLSLLGYDPLADHARITREFGGRRVDLDFPAQSLLLQKPTLQVEHDGGRKIRIDSEDYRRLLDWMAAGAPYGPPDLKVIGIEVTPAENWRSTTNESFALTVMARLSDGTRAEVSALALYASNDDAIAEVTRTGTVTTRGHGLTSIMVRFGGQATAARVAVPFQRGGIDLSEFKTDHALDAHLIALWRRLGLGPSELSRDAEFFRRVHVDLVGRLPSSEATRAFLREPATQSRREQEIDRLLASDEFVDYWTLQLADLLRVGGGKGNESAARVYHGWLRLQVSTGTGWDGVVRSLLMAEGDLDAVGPAGFYAVASDPRELSEQVSSMFLGTQIACARCHAHPTDRWTRDDYHRFAAYFARIRREGGMIRVAELGEVDDPVSGRPLSPRWLGATSEETRMEGDRRTEVAAWITGRDNPFFARTFVNRVWKHLLGRGLVEPVDDLRPTNPATHPALLDTLAAEFVRGGYDLRHLVRFIATSRTYQLSSRSRGLNRQDDRFYSRAYLKPMTGAVFVNAVAQVTGVADAYDGYPPDTRAVQLANAHVASYALDVLGRCSRAQKCETSGSGGGLAQALHLLNGSTVNAKLAGGVVAAMWDEHWTPAEVVEELYLRAYSRVPEPDERTRWESCLASVPDRREAIEDFLWALLNSREFAFNH